MRNIFMKIRLTRDEKDKIFHDAGRCAMCVSTYARQKILGGRPRTKDMTLIRNELAKLGGLLKHLHNEGLGHTQQTAEILFLINAKIHEIDTKEDTRDRDRQDS